MQTNNHNQFVHLPNGTNLPPKLQEAIDLYFAQITYEESEAELYKMLEATMTNDDMDYTRYEVASFACTYRQTVMLLKILQGFTSTNIARICKN